MGTLRDDLLDTTMVRMPDGSYVPQSQIRDMTASQIADLYKSIGGFGSTLDTGTGIQSAQEMFNQTYEEAMANEYLANILEGQGVPDVVPFTLEDTFRPVNVANGIDEFEANYVKDLLDKGLVTIADVAQQTGISEQDIQNTYNEMSGLAVADALNDPTDSTAEIINLTVGSNPMLSDTDLAAAQAAAQSPEVSEAEMSRRRPNRRNLDLTADTTANELLTIGSGDGSLGDAADLGTVSQDQTVDQTTTTSTTADTTAAGTTETVSDVNETWTYNEETNSFISSTLGDSVPNLGGSLVDGQEYQVTPVIGTDGVVAENVVSNTTTTGGNFVLDDIDISPSQSLG